jgi:hypothetical protein
MEEMSSVPVTGPLRSEHGMRQAYDIEVEVEVRHVAIRPLRRRPVVARVAPPDCRHRSSSSLLSSLVQLRPFQGWHRARAVMGRGLYRVRPDAAFRAISHA